MVHTGNYGVTLNKRGYITVVDLTTGLIHSTPTAVTKTQSKKRKTIIRDSASALRKALKDGELLKEHLTVKKDNQGRTILSYAGVPAIFIKQAWNRVHEEMEQGLFVRISKALYAAESPVQKAKIKKKVYDLYKYSSTYNRLMAFSPQMSMALLVMLYEY